MTSFFSFQFLSIPFYSIPFASMIARDLAGSAIYKNTVQLVGSLKLDLVNNINLSLLKHRLSPFLSISLSGLTCERPATKLRDCRQRQSDHVPVNT